MSLDLAGTTPKVVVGTTPFDNMEIGTMLTWVRPTTATANQIMIDKRDPPTEGYRLFIMWDDGRFGFQLDRNPSDLFAFSSASTYTANVWQYLVSTFDMAGANGDQKCFRGLLDTVVSEVSGYDSQLVGSGAAFTNTGLNQTLGNRDAADLPVQGLMAWAAIYDRQLSLAEIRQQQYNIWTPIDPDNCLGFWNLGFNGTGTQPDWSGNRNNGTVSGGAAEDNHVPLGYFPLSQNLETQLSFSGFFPPFRPVFS